MQMYDIRWLSHIAGEKYDLVYTLSRFHAQVVTATERYATPSVNFMTIHDGAIKNYIIS